MTIHPIRPARLAARLAVAGAIALGLAGGVATAASAAPAPSDKGRADIAVTPERPGILIPATTSTTKPPERPHGPEVPDPHPCGGRIAITHVEDCPPPDPCLPRRGVDLPERCQPDPCAPRRGVDLPERCQPDPCAPRRGVDLPERCRPQPCDPKGDDRRPITERRIVDPRDCPPPEHHGCDDPDACDRPVPGKPSFTG